MLYGIALNDLGSSYVHNYVGHEPSGHLFNDIVLDSNSTEFKFLLNTFFYI